MRLIDADKLRHDLIIGHDLVGAKYTDWADTVEAIPVEWLKNELIPKAENLGATEYANNIRFVLEDWEAWKKYRG